MGALVALYGKKTAKLASLISDCQRYISAAAGSSFHPYNLQQIHATIVDLGKDNESLVNESFYEYNGQEIQRNFDGLLHFLRYSGYIPFQVQIGGFMERDYPFVSRGMRPHDRSFALQGGKAVVIGWPIRGIPVKKKELASIDQIQESRIYPNTLDDIRQSLKTFGFLHRYFNRPDDVDNDFYFRIGLYDRTTPEPLQQAIEQEIREFLSNIKPIVIEVTLQDIFIVFSDKETLPVETTTVLPISDPNTTEESLKSINKRQGSGGK